MVSYLVMCVSCKPVCAFGVEGGERTKNRHFARKYPEESDNTTQTLYSATQPVLLGGCQLPRVVTCKGFVWVEGYV